MEIFNSTGFKKEILNRTNYGANIYAHILQDCYPEDTIVMKHTGRDYGFCRNPFANGETTLHIFIEKSDPNNVMSSECAMHTTTDKSIPDGDVFSFAELYYKQAGDQLLETINRELNLNIEEEDDDDWPDVLPEVVSTESEATTSREVSTPTVQSSEVATSESPNITKSPNGDMEISGDNDEEKKETLPTFPDSIFNALPEILNRAVSVAKTREERDILLLGAITVISSALPNIWGIYRNSRTYPNLYLFVTAPAGTGKGRLSFCRDIVKPIHKSLKEQSQQAIDNYEQQLDYYNKNGGTKPKRPPRRELIIYADNSSTGAIQNLNENGGCGLIIETEADTLSKSFNSENGNFSDALRKAFHHETISYNRRKDNEQVEIENPRLSVLLSGTPNQVTTLIPSVENGLFSRFMYYRMNTQDKWENVFSDDEIVIDDHYHKIGNDFMSIYQIYSNLQSGVRFNITKKQQDDFNAYFSRTFNQYRELCGAEYNATIFRLEVMTFRIAMILTALRQSKEQLISPLICTDGDFNTAMSIIGVLTKHSLYVYSLIPKERIVVPSDTPQMKFLKALPNLFNRETYKNVAQKLNIPDSTAQKQIQRFVKKGLLTKVEHNYYQKEAI